MADCAGSGAFIPEDAIEDPQGERVAFCVVCEQECVPTQSDAADGSYLVDHDPVTP